MAKMGQSATSTSDMPDDILEGAPPQPPSMAPKSQPSAFPRSSPSSASAAAGSLSVMGMQPAMALVQEMAELELKVKDITRLIPGMSTAAAPFIAQMRDLGMAALADMAQGGSGGVDLGTGAPPPMMPGSSPAGPMGAGGAGAPGMPGGGAGPMMMPPPPG